MSLHPDLSEHHGGLRLCLSPRVPIPGRGSPLSRYDVVVVFVVVVVSDELDFTCDFGLSDIDECLQTPNPCAYQCRNVPGSFRCQCPPGTVLLGDGRSCAGLEGRQPLGNRTRVRARLRPQLVSSLGRPILSRSTGASRITRQSCPAGYTQRDGTCVGESKSPRTAVLDVQHPRPAETKRLKVFGIFPTTIHLFSCRPLVVQMWTSASSGSPVNTNAGTQRAASRACVQQDISSDPTAAAVKVTCLGPAPPHTHTAATTCQSSDLTLSSPPADIDECVQHGVQCGHNQMCFNTRGGHQCLDTPCPPSYQRSGRTG